MQIIIRRVAILLPILSLLAFVLPAQAQTFCSYGATGTVTAGENLDNIGVQFSLPAGVQYISPFGLQVSTGGSVGQSWKTPATALTNGQTATYTVSIGIIRSTQPPTVTGIGTTDYSTFPYALGSVTSNITLTGGCSDATGTTTSAPPPPPPPPGLPTNSQQGLIVPVDETGSESDTAEAGIQIWGIDENGKGFVAVDLSPEALAELPTNPDSNVTVFESEAVGFYVLDTGELQVNFGPSPDGWVDVIVFDRDLNITNTYRWNIYDVLD